MLDNKKILVTGGTGSFAKFISTVINNYSPEKIIVYSRDELKQYEMQQKWPDGELTDISLEMFVTIKVEKSLQDVDIVAHAQLLNKSQQLNTTLKQLKQILLEVKTSLMLLFQGVKKVIALSTDKAAAPINLYGATKLTSDKLFVAAITTGDSEIKFSVVRYGNVMEVRSVIPFSYPRK